MNLLKISEKPLILDYKDTISKAISKMYENGKDVAIVMENNKYKGLLIAREISKRKVNNPEKTKVINFITHIKPISPNSDIYDVIHSIFINDYKAVPIKYNSNIFLLTKINIINYLKNDKVFKNKKAQDVMVKPFCVTNTDTLSVSISILRDTGICRLPVVDKENKIEGIVDVITLLNAEIKKKRSKRGERSGERVRLGDILIESLMEKNIITVSPNTYLKDVINKMINRTHTVLVVKNGKLEGLITPKLILRLLVKEKTKPNVVIYGIQREDPFLKDIIFKTIERVINKLEKIVHIINIRIGIDKHQEKGKRSKYSVRIILICNKGPFFAKHYDWDLTKAVNNALDKLEREVINKKERSDNRKVYKSYPI